MKKTRKAAIAAIVCLFAIGGVEIGDGAGGPGLRVVPAAEAVVGRPLTPGSAAGVARRTTRRTLRRGAYVATIPRGCPYGVHYGYNLYYCGGVYYQKSGSGFVIVHF